MDRANVDTDQIIPKQFLKRIERTGFGEFLFWDWARLDDGSPNPDFELNQPAAVGASVLLARRNFGCGSSREHAPWALEDYGFRVIIAPSFAEIFSNNCFKNGLLPVVLDEDIMDELFRQVEENPGFRLHVDLEAQTVTTPGGQAYGFEVDAFEKYSLLNGLDEIGLTMQHLHDIRDYEKRRRKEAPWLFPD